MAKEHALHLPNPVLYAAAEAVIFPYIQLHYNTTYKRDPAVRRLEPPFLVIGNHPSTWDPFHMARALHPFRLSFLTSNLFFRHPVVGWALRAIGAVPKIQFRSDPRALKAMLRVISLKGVLGIFPEGTRSADGATAPVRDALAKLVKKAGMPVVTCMARGAYLSRPRWSASGDRRGRVLVETRVLLSAEQVKGSSVEEVRATLEGAIHHNEYDWQRAVRIPFRSKRPAEGLDTILHKCPRCRADLAMRSKGDRLACSACGNEAVMDVYGLLAPKDPDCVVFEDAAAWNAWQRAEMARVCAAPDFAMESRVRLRISDLEQPFRDAGEGRIRLDRGGLRFEGTADGKPLVQTFPLPGILGISADYGENFEIVMDATTYRFYLENGQEVIGYAHAIDLLREERAGA